MELKIQLDSDAVGAELFGQADKHLRKLRSDIGVKITARDRTIIVTGKKADTDTVAKIIDRMQKRLAQHGSLGDGDVSAIIDQTRNRVRPSQSDSIVVYSNKAVIEPFTQGQSKYIRMMLDKDLTFCTGPAGTGKTYLAVAVAVSMLKKKQIRKIVLARPAVEAGEKLGFLPGDIQAKVNPYLRPLFDSLEDMMEFAQMKKFIDMDIIEIIPLAFMRGRTLNEAMVICDEAQNASPLQMLMVLTRLGRDSKMIITGDITQIDLERGTSSGMVDACRTLKGIDGIGQIQLGEADIVRHHLVQTIVQAYDKKNKKTNTRGK